MFLAYFRFGSPRPKSNGDLMRPRPKFYRETNPPESSLNFPTNLGPVTDLKQRSSSHSTQLLKDAPITMSSRLFAPIFRPWTCRSCVQKKVPSPPIPNWRGTYATQAAKQIARPKKKRRILVATASGGTVLAGVFALNDDARHIAGAAQRTGRVVSTLFVCINE
jgi:hypothetical protein